MTRFEEPKRVLSRAFSLLKCCDVEEQAITAITTYCSSYLGVEPKALETQMATWENEGQRDTGMAAITSKKKSTTATEDDNVCVEDEEDDDDDDGDDDDDDNDDDEEEDEADDYNYEVEIHLELDSDDSGSAPPWNLSLSRVPESFLHPDLLDKVKEIFTIVKKRCASHPTCSQSSDYVYPLTTRSVERIFSNWKRLLNRNANTRASTMRALSLLCCFEYAEIVAILKDFPSTGYSNALAKELLTSERITLDDKAFKTLQAKTQAAHQKMRERLLFTKIRGLYKISPPAPNGKIWTKQHSVEFFDCINEPLSQHHTTYSKAETLAKEVIAKYEGLHRHQPPLQHSTHSSSSSLLSLQSENSSTFSIPSSGDEVGVILDDGGSEGSGKDDTGAVEGHAEGCVESDDSLVHVVQAVVDHEYDDELGTYTYFTRWQDDGTKTWEPEDNFVVGFTLSDYWRAKCDNRHLNLNEELQISDISGDDSDDGVGFNEPVDDQETGEYEVLSVSMHRDDNQGVTSYWTKWRGYKEKSWVDEGDFGDKCDPTLAKYWKTCYFKQQGLKDPYSGRKKKEQGKGDREKREKEESEGFQTRKKKALRFLS